MQKQIQKDTVVVFITTLFIYIIALAAPLQAAHDDPPSVQQAEALPAINVKPSSEVLDGVASVPDPCTLKDVVCPQERVTKVDTTNSKKSILVKVCEKAGMPENCWKTLYGIMLTESGGDEKAIGDSGRARGAFQIWYKLHGISIEQAEDFKFAATWTLNNLIKNGFPTYKTWAIGAHNSKTPYFNKKYSNAVKEKISLLE